MISFSFSHSGISSRCSRSPLWLKETVSIRAWTSEPETSVPGVGSGEEPRKGRNRRSRMGDILRAGSVSARSWRERVTTENTGYTEKREKGKELERVIR
jgi:hypothetical protein